MSGRGTVTLDDVAQSVHRLGEAVRGMADDMVDAAQVERIAQEVLSRSRGMPARGFDPADLHDESAAVLGLDDPGLSRDPLTRLEQMHELPARLVARVAGLSEERVREFQTAGDRLVLLGAYLRAYHSDPMSFDVRRLDYFERYRRVVQAMDSTTAAEGDEYVPTGLSGTLIERVNARLQVVALFPEIPMPTQPYDVPALAVDRQRGGRHTEQTADTGQTKIKKITPATRKVTLAAAKFAIEVILSKELEEDSLIPMLPFLDDELVDYTTADLEDAAINGDTAGAHIDADVVDADDPRKNWDGLRTLALADAKADGAGATLTAAMLRANRGKMGKYGIRSGELAHIVSMAGFIQLLSDTNLQTLDKYGPQATILTGELGKVDGAPVIVSEYVRQDLDATGVNSSTAANNTKTIALTVNRRGFFVGTRRGMTVQVLRELYAESDQDAIIVTTRKAFEPRFPADTEPVVALTYNLGTG